MSKKYNLYTLTPLGGLNNSNFKLNIGNKDYFYRKPRRINESLNGRENIIFKLLKGKDISPNLLYYNKIDGMIISEYLYESSVTKDIQDSSIFIKELTKTLKDFHSLSCELFFNPFNEIRNNINFLQNHNFSLPPKINSLLKKLNFLEKKLLENVNLGLCHNDLNSSNILYNNSKAYLIDFEYSGMGDIFYDLATFSWFLSKESKIELLEVYFGIYRDKDYIKLNDYLFVVKLWNATWSYIKSLEYNFLYDYKAGGDLILDSINNS